MIPSRQGSTRRRFSTVASVAALALTMAIPATPATARDPQVGSSPSIVESRLVDGIPAGTRPAAESTRATKNREALLGQPDRPDRGAPSSGPSPAGPSSSTGSDAIAPAQATVGSIVTPGSAAPPVSVFSSVMSGPSSNDPTIAASSTKVMLGSLDGVEWLAPTDPYGIGNGWVAPYTLFAVPTNEYYLQPRVAWSAFKGRFVAAMPTFKDESAGCSTGYLNVAISTTADPSKPWLRFKLSLGAIYPNVSYVGVSDDKLVVTTNQWGLELVGGSCMGHIYQGARIRVVDLPDLVDGGTATFRDLGVGAGYYNWLPVSPAPAPGTTSGGTAIDVIGEQYQPDLGHVAFARITGSAKANTAVLSGGVVDLTSAGIVDAMIGPPIIPALYGADIYFDERPVGVAGRAGHAWLVTNATCTPTGDSAARACARFIELDTTTSPPTLVQDGLYGTSGSDTFLPAVGMATDGKVFLRMTRALSAPMPTPLDQFIVQLAAGESMEGGPQPLLFYKGGGGFNSSPADWASLSSFTLDPGQASTVFNIGPTNRDLYEVEQRLARFRGGLSDAPNGTAILNNGRPWSNSVGAEIKAAPLAMSPIVWMRVSAVPTTATVTGGERLVQGVDFPAGPYVQLDLSRADLGGTTGEGSHSAWIQFRTGAGVWSAPFEKTFQVDLTPPTITVNPVSQFAVGYTVGTTSAVRTSWAAIDDESGIEQYVINRTLTGGAHWGADYTAATTSLVHALGLGKTYRYMLIAWNRAGAMALQGGYGPWLRPLAYQGTSSTIAYYTTFSTATSTSYLGGSTRYSSRAGAKATFTFTGRSAAFVSTKAKTRGKVEVWVDGVKKATIDLYSSTTKYRQVVWAMSWPTSATHKIMIRVVGTAGRPRVDVDAFLKF